MYLESLATHAVTHLLLLPSTLREVLVNIKKGMAQHPNLALLHDLSNIYIYGVPMNYYEYIQLFLTTTWPSFLQVPLVSKLIIVNVYKAYNLPILHPIFRKAFTCPVEGEYLALSSVSDDSTIPTKHDAFVCLLTMKHK